MQFLVSVVMAVLSVSQIPSPQQVETATSAVKTDDAEIPDDIDAKIGRYNATYLSFCFAGHLVDVLDSRLGGPCRGRDLLRVPAEQFYRQVGLTAQADAIAERKRWAHWTTLSFLGATGASATYGGIALALGSKRQAAAGIAGAGLGLGFALISYLWQTQAGEHDHNAESVDNMAEYNRLLFSGLGLQERWISRADNRSIELKLSPTSDPAQTATEPGLPWNQRLRLIHTFVIGNGILPRLEHQWKVVTGPDGRAVPWPEFFDRIDRPDLQQAYDTEQLTKNTLFWGGIGTMVAGLGIGIYGRQDDAPDSLARISLSTLLFGGLLSYAASGMFGGGPSESEVQAAIDLYNQTHNHPPP